MDRPVTTAQRLAFAREAMRRNRDTLAGLESAVEARFAEGDPESAAAWARVAAHWATLNHSGRYASARIERVLGEIGRAEVPACAPAPRRSGPERVLHVLTQAYRTGGHTRLVWRWIDLDADREHRVVLTEPLRGEEPADLAAAAGGELLTLDGTLLERARALRALAETFDLVVLHHHPYDPVPAIALADRPLGPRVIVLDHADHLFWLGTAVADAVAHCRAPALRLAAARRGIDAQRSRVLPIPIPRAQRARTREEAKRALGLDPDTPVLLTVAAAYKLAPVTQPSYAEVAEAILHEVPRAVALVVGAPGSLVDDAARRRTGGRLRTEGVQVDLQPYWDAADVYLDSYPFSSTTSLAEAASHGLPIVSYSPDPAEQDLLLSADPGIEDLIVRAPTRNGVRRAAARLLRDEARREALGSAVREGVDAVHGGAGWRERLEAVYRVARTAPPASLVPQARADEPVAAFDAIIWLMLTAAGHARPLEDLAAAHLQAHPGLGAPPAGPYEEPVWDAVAAPAAEAGSIAAAVDGLARVRAERAIHRLVVTVPHAEVADAVPLLEAALAAHGELDLDLVPADDPAQLLTFGRIAVAGADSAFARAARERGLAVVPT